VHPYDPADHPPARNSQASDLASTSRLLLAINSILFHARDYTQLNAHLQLLSKKHGQLRQAVQKMVDGAMEYVDQLEGDDKLRLIETLRDITEGKVRLHYLSFTVRRACACARARRSLVNSSLTSSPSPAPCRSTSRCLERA